jgi:hypothetical protein
MGLDSLELTHFSWYNFRNASYLFSVVLSEVYSMRAYFTQTSSITDLNRPISRYHKFEEPNFVPEVDCENEIKCKFTKQRFI